MKSKPTHDATDPRTLDAPRPASSGRSLYAFVDGRVAIFPLLPEGHVVVGRAESAGVRIVHPSVSREHARIGLGPHVTIEDLGSANGTFVAGVRLAPQRPVLVAPGSWIEVGGVVLLFRNDGAATPEVLGGTDGTHGGTQSLRRTVARIAATDLRVLVLGETGVGKEHLAEEIHAASPRAAGPLVRVRCAAATAAVHAAFEQARSGTVLLDEIADLDVAAQARVTAALADGAAGARIVATSARDVDDLARRSALRIDLVHQLDGVRVVIPPLRARAREIEGLATAVMARVAAEQGRPPPILAPDALRALEQHPWPGNVRELANVITRATMLCAGRVLTRHHLGDLTPPAAVASSAGTLARAVQDAEYQRIVAALAQCNGNQTRAAKLLGVSRGTLLARLDRYRVPRPRK